MRFVLMICAAALAVFLWSNSAFAQGVCDTRDDILRRLFEQYAESVVGRGLMSNGYMMERTVSDAGTWSLVITKPGNQTCLVVVGRHWQDITPGKIGPKM